MLQEQNILQLTMHPALNVVSQQQVNALLMSRNIRAQNILETLSRVVVDRRVGLGGSECRMS